MFEYAPQASNLASKGRYGDSMLVHMNPAEVGIMNAISGDRMTINPETGQPEAFAFLLPMLGGLLGAGAAGSLGYGLLGTAALTGLGSGIGQTAATGSLKDGIMTGLGSFALAGLGGALAGAESAAGGAGGTSSGLGGALTPELTEAINYVDTLGAGTGFASTAASQAPTSVFETIGGLADPTKLNLGDVSTFKDFGNLAGVALPVGVASSTVSPELYGPTYGDYDGGDTYKNIPEADPPTRRLRRMPANFAQNNTGEFKFFEDPAKERVGESARNFFPGGSTAEREMRYGGRPMFAEAGGLMRSFDKDQIREDGGKLPGIAGALFGVGNPQKFFGMSPEQLMLLEKKKAKRMQEGGDVTLEEETVVTEEMPMGNDTRSDPEMEQDAMIFNAGVNAVMCESNNAAQDLQMFVERFGMDRLHQIICEVMEMAQGEEVEGELTKEDTPIAMQAGGSVDTIPASLEGKQSYLLAENEYIVPEPVVRAVGNGDPEMGAMAFDRFVDQVKATA
jgi:hypothetical protein